jgi:hypothetical protein
VRKAEKTHQKGYIPRRKSSSSSSSGSSSSSSSSSSNSKSRIVYRKRQSKVEVKHSKQVSASRNKANWVRRKPSSSSSSDSSSEPSSRPRKIYKADDPMKKETLQFKPKK